MSVGKVSSINSGDLQLFMALLRAAITDDKCALKHYMNDDINWDWMDKIAQRNNLVSMLYYTVSRNDELKTLLLNHIEYWREQARSSFFLECSKHTAIKEILIEAENENVQLVFFKGLVLADLYPQFVLRNSSDTDIFVYEKDRDKAEAILLRLGYVKNEEHSKTNVPVYVSDRYQHIVELHFSLWEDYDGKKIHALNEMKLTDENTLIDIDACKLKITTLGHEQHLIYQMFHIIKHFITESIGVRYLIDITLFINAYGNKIDYTRFWNAMEQLGYTKFCINLFSLCVKYFHMDRGVLGNIALDEVTTEETLLLDMVHKGLLYEDKTSPWQILGIMTPYLVGEERVPRSSLKRKWKVLFPSAKALPEHFGYAKRNRWLLPIAWVHKMVDFIIRYKNYNKIYKDWYNPNEKLHAAEYRLELVRKMGL